MKWVALCLFLGGGGGVGWGAWSALNNLDLVTEGQQALVTRVVHGGKNRSRVSWFQVGGQEYPAYGRILEVGDVVVYAPADPHRNRARLYVGGLNEAEQWAITLGGIAMLGAVMVAVFEWAMTNRDELAVLAASEPPRR